MSFPAEGLPPAEILAALRSFKTADLDWQRGRVWAYIYQPDEAATTLLEQAYLLYLSENCLDPTTFPARLALSKRWYGWWPICSAATSRCAAM